MWVVENNTRVGNGQWTNIMFTCAAHDVMVRPTSGFLYFTLKAFQLEKRAAVGKHLHSIIQSCFYHCKLP